MERRTLIRGVGANRGRRSGRVKVILSRGDISRLKEGDILVTDMTLPDWVPSLTVASAIVTDLGGTTSHAAIISRELGIPTIVGCEQATSILDEGRLVTVDGGSGCVYEGNVTEGDLPDV